MAKDDIIMEAIRERLVLQEGESAIDQKLLRDFFSPKNAPPVSKSIRSKGPYSPERRHSIYAGTKFKTTEITEEIKVIASKIDVVTDVKQMARLEKDYTKLSDNLKKYSNAMMLSKEWALQ
jgi:hypothetical protein